MLHLNFEMYNLCWWIFCLEVKFISETEEIQKFHIFFRMDMSFSAGIFKWSEKFPLLKSVMSLRNLSLVPDDHSILYHIFHKYCKFSLLSGSNLISVIILANRTFLAIVMADTSVTVMLEIFWLEHREVDLMAKGKSPHDKMRT